MKLRSRNFPHPVLRPHNDDFISSTFRSEISLIEQRDSSENLQFNIENFLNNKELEKMIFEKKVNFAVHFECPSTMQRLLYCDTVKNFTVSIPKEKLNKRVDVNFFILAVEEINDYINSDVNTVFSGVNFKIQKGDILAYSESKTINIEKTPISKTNSIFKLIRGNEANLPSMSFDYQQNQIEIILPNDTYERVSSLQAYGEDSNRILITMFYFPALIDVFHYIQSLKDGADDFTLDDIANKDWYRTLEKKLEIMNIDILELPVAKISSLSFDLLFKDNSSPLLSLENLLDIEGKGNNDYES